MVPGPIGVGDEFGVAESIATADYDVDGFMDRRRQRPLYPYGVAAGPFFRNTGNNSHGLDQTMVGTFNNPQWHWREVYVTAGRAATA
jgi:hypothetical protein